MLPNLRDRTRYVTPRGCLHSFTPRASTHPCKKPTHRQLGYLYVYTTYTQTRRSGEEDCMGCAEDGKSQVRTQESNQLEYPFLTHSNFCREPN